MLFFLNADMTQVYRFKSALESRLTQLIQTADGIGLRNFLETATNAERRTAALILSDTLLLNVEEDIFWQLFEALVPHKAKAYLGTFLKAAKHRYKSGKLHFTDVRLQRFTQHFASNIDKQKLLSQMMPYINQVEDAKVLLDLTKSLPLNETAKILAQCATPLAFFHLLHILQEHDMPLEYVRNLCLLLMKSGRHLSFNMAGILAAYYGLDNLPGTFSLHILPYELSRLDASYEQFRSVLMKI